MRDEELLSSHWVFVQESPHYQYHRQQLLHRHPPHLEDYWLVQLAGVQEVRLEITHQAYHELESQLGQQLACPDVGL